MAKIAGSLPLGKNTPLNVAVQRPTVNMREAENLNEQAAAVANRNNPEGFRFSRHGTLGPQRLTDIEK